MKIATLVKTGDGPLWIIPHVLAARAAGDEVVVLLPAPHHRDSQVARELAAHDVPVVESPAPLAGASLPAQLAAVGRLRATLRELGVDVVHYHLYASALAARLATVGTPITRVHMVAGPLYLDNTLIRRAERVLCRLDHLLIASTGDIRDRYAALGLPEHRIRTLPHGIDLDHFSPASPRQRRAARADLGFGADELVAVCVAYFYPPKRMVHPGRGVKGHEVLLEAWSRFTEQGGRGTLVLLGSGYGEAGERYREQLRAAWAARPGADRVRWVDSVRDVRPFYAAADVNVVSSWSEGYGSGREAAACGVPTVATAAGGLPEIVDDETGWLVDLGDAAALAEALLDAAAGCGTPAARQRAEATRRRAERMLDRRLLSQDTVAALHDAAARRPPRSRTALAVDALLARLSAARRLPARAATSRIPNVPHAPASAAGGLVRRLPELPGLARRVGWAAYRSYLLRTDPVCFARRIGVRVGDDCRLVEITPATFGTEPYLIRLGHRVGIAGGVRFITHDGAVTRLRREHPDVDVVAPIRVGDNSVIGLNAVIMPGVTIGSDVIVAAGAIVMRDVSAGSVVAGAPARVISDVEQWERRALARSVGTGRMSPRRKREVFLARFAAQLDADLDADPKADRRADARTDRSADRSADVGSAAESGAEREPSDIVSLAK
ncbi:glycosyltransferase [Frankia sp. Ag45/Mut15]|uniref:Glycosyltransferase n=1 Tax=Frankia umida TaxID=573489 RepID=A0ABT0K5B4_9ACTN|nr:glycosyltransferase [Frankia umida]MCK9878968.1 glycosyltransferase [Frankia umida]